MNSNDDTFYWWWSLMMMHEDAGGGQVPRLTVGVVWGPGPVVGVLHQDRDHSGQVCGRGVVVGIAYSASQDSRCKIWNLNLQKSQTCLPICCRLQCCQEGEGWLKGGGAFLHRARMSMVDLQHPCCRGLEWVSSFQKLPGWIASGGGGGGAQLQRWFQKVNFPVKPDKTPGPHSCAIIILHISTQNHFRQKLTI